MFSAPGCSDCIAAPAGQPPILNEVNDSCVICKLHELNNGVARGAVIYVEGDNTFMGCAGAGLSCVGTY